MALLKPRYYLALHNLPQAVKAETLLQQLSQYTSLKGLKVSSSRTKYDATAEVWSEDKQEIVAAAHHFYKHEKWTWVKGRVPRVEMRMSSGTPDSKSFPDVFKHVQDGEKHLPEFIGERSNDRIEAFIPGVVVRLPEFKQRNMGVEMDVRVRHQYQLYGNPAIIVHNHGNGLVNVVLCTDFAGHTPAVAFDGKREIIRQRLLKRIAEISTLRRHLANGSEGLDPQLLHFERGRMLLTNRTWAELTVYTMDLKALARLEPSTTTGQEAVQFGYTKLADPQMLLGMIKRLGEDAEKVHRTELRGSDLRLLKYPERLKVIKRAQHDAREFQKEEEKKARLQEYQEWKVKNSGWKIYTEPEEIMRHTLRKIWHDSKGESWNRFRREVPGLAVSIKASQDDPLGAKLGKFKRPIGHVERYPLDSDKRINRNAQQQRVELHDGLDHEHRGLRTAGPMQMHRGLGEEGGVFAADITQSHDRSIHDHTRRSDPSGASELSPKPLKIMREGAKPPLPKHYGPSPKGIKIVKEVSGNRPYQGTRPELRARHATGVK